MLSKMAANTFLSVSKSYFFNFSGNSLNFQVRNFSKRRVMLELLGSECLPKRPLTPFLRFLADHRQKAMAQNPDKKHSEILKTLGSQWTELPKIEKQKYYEEYLAEKKEYNEKIKKQTDSLSLSLCNKSLDLNKNKLIQALSDLKSSEIPQVNSFVKFLLMKSLNKPKAPATSFLKYLNEIKIQEQGANLTKKEISDKWKSLPQEEKEKYKQIYVKEWEKYVKELDIWEQEMIKKGFTNVVRVKTLKEIVNKNT